MLRDFCELNHYEVLDLSPSASPLEVRYAYKTALGIYREESLVSYSLFSVEERKRILARLEEAYYSLVHEKDRVAYDRKLISRGEMKEEDQHLETIKANPRPVLRPVNGPVKKAVGFQGDLKSKVEENSKIRELLAQEVLTGRDLKVIREERGISLEDISRETKIRTGLLQCLEDEQFAQFPSRHHLRGFLKAYLHCLQIETEAAMERYLKRVQA